MAEKILTIQGMSCGHCIKAVTMSLGDLPGVQVRDVTIGAATIDVDDSLATDAQLRDAIGEAGFTLVTAAASPRR